VDIDLTYTSDWLDLRLPTCWVNIYNACRRASSLRSKYGLCACLATAAFGERIPLDLLATLVSFATTPAFRNLNPPSHSLFQLNDSYKPTAEHVSSIVLPTAYQIENSPSNSLAQREGESTYEHGQRQMAHYNAEITKHWSDFVQSLVNQWPSTHPKALSSTYSSWFRVNDCLVEVHEYFSSCARNVELCDHLRQLEQVLSSHPASAGTSFTRTHSLSVEQLTLRAIMDPWSTLCLGNLMYSRPCPDPMAFLLQSRFAVSMQSGSSADTSRLSDLFAEFRHSSQPLNRLYGEELDESQRDLDKKPRIALPQNLPPVNSLVEKGQQCKSYLQSTFE
jgi:hypothetical protein